MKKKFYLLFLISILLVSTLSAVDIYYDPASKLDHNELSGIEGLGLNYFHLNQAEYDSVLNINGTINASSYWTQTAGVLSPTTATDSVNIATGSEYQQNGVNLISVPSTSATSIAIGNTGFTGTGNYNLLIGNSAGDDLTTATSNVMMGDHAGFRQTGKNNVYIGYQAGYGVNGASNGEANIGIGKNSLLSVTTGYNNIAIGLEAGNKIAGALYNNYIGTYAGRYQTGSGNFALGYNALAGVNGASNGANNIVMGYYAGSRITTGSTNLLLGRNNGLGLSTHSGNVFLGYEVGKTNLVASNQLAIDNSDTATPLIYGEFDNDFIKINGYLTLATKTLEGTPVAGSLEYDGCSMYVTNVATQRAIDRTSDVAVETVTVAGTTTETTLWTGVQSANSLCAGNLLKFHADGIISNGGATAADQITLRIKVGGSTVATLAPITKSIPIGSHWHIDANATQRTIGASGSRAVHIDLVIDDNEETVITTATIDTTASMDVTITAEWASADADNTISLYQGFMEYKN